MTISLPLDAAYALDYYAILQVKCDNKLKEVFPELLKIQNCIAIQVGERGLSTVERSKEFKELYKANLAVFNIINKAHKDEVTASEVQRLNMERYKAKVALQQRFWPDSKLKEVKSAT